MPSDEHDSAVSHGDSRVYWFVLSIVAVGAAWIFGEIGWVNHSPIGGILLGLFSASAILAFGYVFKRLEEGHE